MNAPHPALRELFAEACAGTEPVMVPVGENFEIVTLPGGHVRAVIGMLAHHRPHPVGAAIAEGGRWSVVVPPGSGEPPWPAVAEHQAGGWLRVPPFVTGPDEPLRWARFGNENGRVFTAPLLLNLALPAVQPDGPPSPLTEPHWGRASRRVPIPVCL